MEFDEMKKIWDAQNNTFLYSIDEQALHRRILSKKNQGGHITNVSELLLILVNVVAGGFVFGTNFHAHSNLFLHGLAAWMLISGLYVLFSRIRRIKGAHQFDRSMHGDLQHAIWMATYQVRLSQLGRWNILPVAILLLLGMWESGKPIWLAIALLVFLGLASYGAQWEHNLYKKRKRELETLKHKLENQ